MFWTVEMPDGRTFKGLAHYSYRRSPIGEWVFNDNYHKAMADGGTRTRWSGTLEDDYIRI